MDYTEKPRVKKDANDMFEVDILPRQGVVKASPLDRAITRMVRGHSVTEPGDDSQCDLMGDTFLAMYQTKTELRENVPPERAVNAALLNWMTSNPEYEKGKWSSTANIPASLVSSSLMWENLTRDESLKEAMEAQKKAEEAKKELEELLKQMSEGQGDEDSEERAKQLQEKMEQYAQQGVKSVEKLQKNPLGQGMMSRAVKKGVEKGKETADAMRGWGLGPGDINPVDASSVLKMLENSKDKIKKIAELAGKFKKVSANSIEQTRKSYTGPVNEIALTRDFMKLMPTERLAFYSGMPPILRTNKVLQFVAHGLPGFINKSEGKLSGNFIAMVDGSGSMHGMREEMAKAISLGVAYAVREDREADRHYKLCMFGDSGDAIQSVTSEDDWKEHIAWASFMPGGGTDFDYSLKEAMEYIRTSKNKGEDLLFITDGGAMMSDRTVKEWRELKAEKGCKLLYIGIGSGGNEQVKKLADLFVEVTSLDDKTSEELVVKITEQIIRSEGDLK